MAKRKKMSGYDTTEDMVEEISMEGITKSNDGKRFIASTIVDNALVYIGTYFTDKEAYVARKAFNEK